MLAYGDKYHGHEIPDPYGKKPKDYELALDMIEDGCRGLVESKSTLPTSPTPSSPAPGESFVIRILLTSNI